MSEHNRTLSRRTFLGGTAAIIGLSGLGLSTISHSALAVTSAEKNAEADLLAQSAAEKQAEAASVLETLDSMHEKADILAADYFTALGEKDEAEARMNDAQSRIDQKSAEIENLQKKLGERARSMYRNGSFTFLDMLLGATTFSAFASNWDLLNDINKGDQEMVQQTKDLRTQVEAEKAEYEKQREIAQQKADEAAAAKAEADALIAETQSIYDSLDAEAQQLLAQEEAAREEARQLAAEEEEARRRAEEERRRAAEEAARAQAAAAAQSNSESSSSSAPAYNESTGNAIVDRAYSQLGKPYVWGAVGPNSFDCSGLVSYCLTGSFSRLGTTYTFMGWPRVSNPQPGDVVTTSSHCGIYIGGGQMIHAPHTGDVVKISAVQSNMIYVRY